MEEQKVEDSSLSNLENTPQNLDSPKKPNDGIRVNFRIPISKKILLRVIIPVVAVLLLTLSLFQQGYIADLFNNFKKASAVAVVVDEKDQPIEGATFTISSISTTSDKDGKVIVENLTSGNQSLLIQKTGFIALEKTIKLDRGTNDLGQQKLTETPTPKISLSLSVLDYISEEPINNATVKIGDIIASFDSGKYVLNKVPVGKIDIIVSSNGYNTYSSELTLEETTTTVEAIKLVKTGLVVFESNRDGGKRGIFTANYDGSNQKSLIPRVGDFEDFNPTLSPDQSKVLFYSTRAGKKGVNIPYKITPYVVDIDGKNLNAITDTEDNYFAAWSPDGSYISLTYSETTSPRTRLLTYNISSKAVVLFTSYQVDKCGPTFSPNSKYIAFCGTQFGQSIDYGLFLGSSNAQNIKKIEISTYSPDSIDFNDVGQMRYSFYDGITNKTRYMIYDPVSDVKTESTIPYPKNLEGILSPDKKLRAYTSTRDGKTNIYISDLEGKNEKKITDLNKINGGITWSKDSSFVLFNVYSASETARYLVSLNGTAKAKKIVDINLSYY